MKIFKEKKKLINEISKVKNITFVPTMGSLHLGHLSLIEKAKKKSKNVLVSIYVNPKQFNSTSNFNKYPRNINKDIALLKKINIKYLFLPTYEDLYSFDPKLPLSLDIFSKKLCGKFRPGHFKGVINVVNRFLDIIKPRSIYLGVKDFQQLSLIKLHIRKNKIKTNVVGCSTIREKNGMALSSRNNKLHKEEKKIAGKIYHYIKQNKKHIFSMILKNKKIKIINKIKLLGVNKIDYLESLNLNTLKKAKNTNEKYNIFIAYYMGKIRLIDNL
jgi:pantoate--beta-alanine ligase